MTLFIISIPLSSSAQRRARPGSMKHSESEVINKQKIKQVHCKYIKDGSVFEGAIYRTGDLGGVKIGDAFIAFTGGEYMFSFSAEKFKMKNNKYYNVWEYKKLMDDFDYSGKYSTFEQYGQIWLVLYNEDNEEFAKIPIDSLNAKSFSFEEDRMLMKMNFIQ